MEHFPIHPSFTTSSVYFLHFLFLPNTSLYSVWIWGLGEWLRVWTLESNSNVCSPTSLLCEQPWVMALGNLLMMLSHLLSAIVFSASVIPTPPTHSFRLPVILGTSYFWISSLLKNFSLWLKDCFYSSSIVWISEACNASAGHIVEHCWTIKLEFWYKKYFCFMSPYISHYIITESWFRWYNYSLVLLSLPSSWAIKN